MVEMVGSGRGRGRSASAFFNTSGEMTWSAEGGSSAGWIPGAGAGVPARARRVVAPEPEHPAASSSASTSPAATGHLRVSTVFMEAIITEISSVASLLSMCRSGEINAGGK